MKPKIEFVLYSNFESDRDLDFTQWEKTCRAIIIENESLPNIHFHFDNPSHGSGSCQGFYCGRCLNFANHNKFQTVNLCSNIRQILV